MKFKIGKKKYKIREFSPAWWTIKLGGAFAVLFGFYVTICTLLII